MEVMLQETFGPLIGIMKVKDDAAIIALERIGNGRLSCINGESTCYE